MEFVSSYNNDTVCCQVLSETLWKCPWWKRDLNLFEAKLAIIALSFTFKSLKIF